MSVRLERAVEIDAEPAVVWDLVVDWERQGEWILLSRVEGGSGPGATVKAFTGVGPLGVLDTMTITGWEPPYRCLVKHTGAVIKGTGAFVVEPLPRGRSRFVWSEDVDLPLGLLGRVGWHAVVGPLMSAGLAESLRRLARLAADERGSAPGSAPGSTTDPAPRPR